jgi:hypothetical protein
MDFLLMAGDQVCNQASKWHYMSGAQIDVLVARDPANPEGERHLRAGPALGIAAFGSFTVPHERAWKYDGAEYIEIVKFEIVTANDMVPKKYLKDLKERLKETFRKVDILITTHRIQTV